MDEKKHPGTEDVEINVGEIDVAVAPQKEKRDMFLPISILVAAVFVGGRDRVRDVIQGRERHRARRK